MKHLAHLCTLAGLLAVPTSAVADSAAAILDLTGREWPPITNAYGLAQLSEGVYKDDGPARRHYIGLHGFSERRYIDTDTEAPAEEHVQVLMANAPGLLVVAVRGTEIDFEDFWTVGQATQYEPDWHDDVQIHNGFLKSADDIYARVLPEVRAARREGREVIFTGHSLGGAITQVLAFRAALDGVEILQVVTFAAPMVGNADFVEAYDDLLGDRTAHFVNEGDPVPCLPQRLGAWWYDRAGETWHLAAADGLPMTLTRTDETGCRLAAPDGDHKLLEYIDHIDELRGIHSMRVMKSDGTLGHESFRAEPVRRFVDVVGYSVGSADFVLLSDRTTGRVEIRRPSGQVVEERNLNIGKPLGAFVEAGKTHLVTIDALGYLHAYPFYASGALCATAPICTIRSRFVGLAVPLPNGRVLRLNPYTQGEVYTAAGFNYVLLLSSATGKMAVHAVDAAAFGVETDSGDWTAGWTTSEAFVAGGKSFLFLLKRDSGQVKIMALRPGSVGEAVHTYDWTAGWTTAVPYLAGGKAYLFLLKQHTGQVHVNRINANGSIGDIIDTADWRNGWQAAAAVANGIFMVRRHDAR